MVGVVIEYFVFLQKEKTVPRATDTASSGSSENSKLSTIPIAAALATILTNEKSVELTELYAQGATGYAISYPQCGIDYPSQPYDFGILGVTKGRSLTKNPCLKSELEWANKGVYSPAFYINLSNPPLSKTIVQTLGCNQTDQKCPAYRFGYQTAKEAHEYAVSQGALPGTWWLDVQTISSWSTDTTLNAQVILGAAAYFKEQSLTVGLSTTPYQWNMVTGGLETGLPTWVPGRDNKKVAEKYCLTGKSYSGGPLKQVAYIESGFEAVYACGE